MLHCVCLNSSTPSHRRIARFLYDECFSHKYVVLQSLRHLVLLYVFDDAIIRRSYDLLLCHSNIELSTSKCLKTLIYRRSFDRKSRTLFSDVLSSYGFNTSDISVFLQIYRFFASNLDVDISLFSGADSFLESVCNDNVVIIITNGPVSQQANKVKLLGLERRVHGVIYCDGLKIPLKPDPSSVLKFLNTHDFCCDLQSAIVIGDDYSTDGELASLLGCKYIHPSRLWRLV